MEYDKLMSNVDEVRKAARAAAAVYLGSYTVPEADPTVASATASGSEPASVLDDPKVKALLQAALRNPTLFARPPEEIYDLKGSLLFRDFVFPLDGSVELRVRTGANKALGAVIVSVSVAQPRDQAAAIVVATARAAESDLGVPQQPVRVVCYAYPNLGIVLTSGRQGPVVMDLVDGTVHPMTEGTDRNFWKPYDQIAPNVAEDAAARFGKEHDALTEASSTATPRPLVLEASTSVPEHKIRLNLIRQESQNFCAPAAAAMILQHHGLADLDQHKIARKFAEATKPENPTEGLEIIRNEGTRPLAQQKGLNDICRSIGFVADISFLQDVQGNWNGMLPRILDELKNNRPIQRQLKGHVDVIGGWRGMAGTDDLMLWIYDPRGDVRLDRWGEVSTNINDLIFIHPVA